MSLQQILDRDKVLTLPLTSPVMLDVPVFLDHNNLVVRGPGTLNTFRSKASFIIGWRRGLIDDSHYTAQGFRTKGDCSLYVQGTDADLGPKQSWANVKKNLSIRFSATTHESSWHQPLFGIQETTPKMINGRWTTYYPCPSPFLCWMHTERLHFALGLHPDLILGFIDPEPYRTPSVDFTIFVDLEKRQVTLTDHLTSTTRPLTPLINNSWAHTSDWPEGARLKENSWWPLGINRMPPHASATGYWGAEPYWADVTIHNFMINYDVNAGGGLLGRLWSSSPRPATYSSGPSLPLVPWQGNGICLVSHRSQGNEGDPVRFITLRDINIIGGGDLVSSVHLAAAQGSVLLERLSFDGCARAVQTTGIGVVYPLDVVGVSVLHCSDASLWLNRCYRLNVTRCELAGARCAAELIGCTGKISDTFIRPTMSVAHVIQSGGDMTYDHCLGNFEWEPVPPFALVRPHGVESDSWPTEARFIRCSNGWDSNVYSLLPAHPTYKGSVNVKSVSF